MEYTKGPWKVHPCNRRGKYSIENQDLCSTDTALVNARLIAAAPEMIEALELINQWAKGFKFKNIQNICEPLIAKIKE